MENKEGLLKILKDTEIVRKNSVKLSSGKISDYYVDIKKSYGDPRIIQVYISYIIGLFFRKGIKEYSCVIASGYGGIPLAVALSLRLSSYLRTWNLKLSMFRDKQKEHGTKAIFEGFSLEKLNRNKKIIIVDDVFTTGGSIRKILEALPEGLKVGKIIVICNRSGIENPEINGVPVEYLFTAEELMEELK